ncbi:MAG: N-acetylmuramoyl-L-alanine amidase [Bacillota bacterium]
MYHRLMGLLTLLLLLSACAAPVQVEGPPVPPEPESRPAPRPLPAVESLRFSPSLAVKTTKQALAFTGRGPWFMLVAEIPPGTALEYLGSREGWLRILTPDGRRAWVVANDTELTDGRGQGGRYRIQAGRWEMAAPSGATVRVSRLAPGVMRVVLEGLPPAGEGPEVVELGDRALALLAPVGGSFEGALELGDSGLTQVSLGPRGALIDLERPTTYAVISRSAERMEVEIRPALVGVEPLPDGWRFTVRGEGRPVLRPEGQALLVDIPAAVWRVAEAPPGLVWEKVAPEAGGSPQPLSSPTATIPVRMPAGGLRIRLPLPDQLYALRQPEPGRFELRWVSPGLAGKRIVVDPGHGGEETGAVGRSGVPEKAVNLAVALRLKPLLEAAGAEVIMTRTEDRRVISPEEEAQQTSYQERTQVDLQARSALANRVGADLFISIHANGGPAGDGGIEVFWAVPNLNAAESRRLAGLAQAELVRALGLADRGVKQRPFNVIRYSEAPAILVEMGFMTNPAEEQLLLSEWGQQQAAEALLRAVEAFFRG